MGLTVSVNFSIVQRFFKVAGLPALASLPIVWAIVAFLYRNCWQGPAAAAFAVTPAASSIPVNHWETAKAAEVTFAVVLAFVFSSWPRELIALPAAALLLMNRQISSSDMMKHIDGNMLLLFIGLFVVNAALAATGLPQDLLTDLHSTGMNLDEPLWLFATVCASSAFQ
jgi:Na+/H+ antiporter NhaD/arsenite permease-like protein